MVVHSRELQNLIIRSAPDLSWYPPLTLRIRKASTPIYLIYQAFQIAIWHFGLPIFILAVFGYATVIC
jgi:hypothetical protein